MPDAEDVCILIPTLNEAETIGDVLERFETQGYHNILVIDGNSDDDTADIAEKHGAEVMVQTGTGKGQAVREALRHIDAPYILMLDGDGTYDPEEADRMLEPLENGADHVIGNRFADMERGAMTRFNRMGNTLFNRTFCRVHGQNYRDILSGYRAFTRASAERMYLNAEGFGIETEMSVECVKHGFDVEIVPITYRARPTGSDPNLHPIADGWRILMTLYSLAKTTNPMFYFGSVGAVATAIGLILGTYVGVEWFTQRVSHEVIAVLATLSLLFGGMLVIFGFLSDLLVTLHREQLRRIEDLEEKQD